MSAVLITIDGVLRSQQGATIMDGLLVYSALSEAYDVMLLADVIDLEMTERWLKVNGFRNHNKVYPRAPEYVSDTDSRIMQVGTVRAAGHSIAFVLDPSVEVAERLLRISVPTMLFLQPKYVAAASRPDYDGSPRPWDELVAEVELQREARSMEET